MRLSGESAYTMETTVAALTGGDGGADDVALTPSTARRVRVTSVTRATRYGLSLSELEVYRH